MDYKLNPSEWRVLQTLWGHAPQTLMQLVSNLQRSTDWSASTIKTLVSRMTDKGVLRFEGERPRLYYPGIQKEDAAFSETQQLLSRAFGGNFGLLMSNFIDNAKLSKDDLEELYDMLRQAEETQEIGNMRTAAADLCRQLLLCHGKILHQALIGLCFFNSLEVFTL